MDSATSVRVQIAIAGTTDRSAPPPFVFRYDSSLRFLFVPPSFVNKQMGRKHCVQSYNVFDFLREVVSKVPDYGHSDVFGNFVICGLSSFLREVVSKFPDYGLSSLILLVYA
ncbi:hypothetical protein L6452_15251 [Arctium lappa]|uniref:Uncharacterized protein n=1 Tax=Arctium lappa TaxID=4217 RepID=A0ACB9CND4_ARCLA|nr:hypothetical protein L6452_15251 [Arctium lappa]